VEAGSARDLLGGVDLLRGEVRGADPAHLALVDEVVERAERFLDRRERVGLVHLVHVDHVGAQPAQRALDGPTDVVRVAASLLGTLAHLAAGLCRGEEAIAPALERAAYVLVADPLPADARLVAL